MGWSVRRWFQRQQQPAEPQESPQLPVEMHEVPTTRTQFYERHTIAWERAKAEFNSRTWPLLIVGDVSQRARTRLPVGLVDASPAELGAAYVRGEIPYIPLRPILSSPRGNRKSSRRRHRASPTRGRLISTYVHRDPTTELETARGYGLKVADIAVLGIQSAGGVICEGELGSSNGSPLHGAAAIERIVHQVIDTFAHVRPFLHYDWDKDHQPGRSPRKQ